MDFKEKMSTMVTRKQGARRISKVPIADDAIPPDAQLTQYMLARKLGANAANIICKVSFALTTFFLATINVTRSVLPYATFVAIGTLLIGQAEADEKINFNKNWIYRRRNSANLNSEIVMLLRSYTPCDMQELLINVDESLHRNSELCNRQFPNTINQIQYVNASTATGNYVTLQGRLTVSEARVRCAAIGTSLVTAKTTHDAARLYQYMAHHYVNETFADITIDQLNMEPTFWSDGALANGNTSFANSIKSTQSYYKDDMTWQQVIDQFKKTNQLPIFTYGLTTALKVAVFMHRENAPYSKTSSGGVGTTLRLTAICNQPDNKYEQPEIITWRQSCKANLHRNQKMAAAITARITSVMPNNLPQATQPYPSIIKLNSAWDDKTTTTSLLNIVGHTFDTDNNPPTPNQPTTPFRLVRNSIVEQAEMTISQKCSTWLADLKPTHLSNPQQSSATNTTKLEPHPCDNKPISMNYNTKLYGCEGAVYHNLDPAQEYCEGGQLDQYMWYKTCCTWTGQKCAPNPAIHSRPQRYAAIIPGFIAAARAGLAMTRMAWPAISAGASVGQFIVEMKSDDDEPYEPQKEHPVETYQPPSNNIQQDIGFDFLFQKYRTLQAASFAFSEATHLDTLFMTTMNQAHDFSKEFHKAIARVAHTSLTPDITDFMSIKEFEAIRHDLVTRYQVITPSSMKTTKLRLFTSKNSYFILFAMPRETDTSLVDVYQLFSLPIFRNGKKFHPAKFSDYFALTSKGTQIATQLTTAEADECLTTGVCEASHPTLPMNKAPCGIDAITNNEDKCTWIEAQGMDPEFIIIDAVVYYALPPNTSVTMEIRCRGLQNRGLDRQSLTLEEGYGQFTFQSPECSGHWKGIVLSPSRRSIDIDQWTTTTIGKVHPSPTDNQQKNIHVTKRYRFPDKWSLVAKLGIAAALALLLGVFIMCGMGHLCPVAVMACATPFRVMDIARLYRRHEAYQVNAQDAPEQVALQGEQIPELIDIDMA